MEEEQMPSFTQEEAKNMAYLFLHTATNQISLEETKLYKSKDGEK